MNASAPVRLLGPVARLDADARALLVRAANQLSLSARSYHRVLRVARTIADLDGEEGVAPGQACVFYEPASSRMLGGGWIVKGDAALAA